MIAIAGFEVVFQEIRNLDFEQVAARRERCGDVETERRSPSAADLVPSNLYDSDDSNEYVLDYRCYNDSVGKRPLPYLMAVLRLD